MATEKAKKNAGYLQIVSVLKALREKGVITKEEYENAQEYYVRVTGADIVIVNPGCVKSAT